MARHKYNYVVTFSHGTPFPLSIGYPTVAKDRAQAVRQTIKEFEAGHWPNSFDTLTVVCVGEVDE